MVCKNLMLSTVHWTRTLLPRLTANWNSCDRCIGCRLETVRMKNDEKESRYCSHGNHSRYGFLSQWHNCDEQLPVCTRAENDLRFDVFGLYNMAYREPTQNSATGRPHLATTYHVPAVNITVRRAVVVPCFRHVQPTSVHSLRFIWASSLRPD